MAPTAYSVSPRRTRASSGGKNSAKRSTRLPTPLAAAKWPSSWRTMGAAEARNAGEKIMPRHPPRRRARPPRRAPPPRDGADRVLGLATADPGEQRREEQREALDAHADRLGGREVPELVEDDERREAEEREEEAHAAAPTSATSAAATARASPSAR